MRLVSRHQNQTSLHKSSVPTFFCRFPQLSAKSGKFSDFFPPAKTLFTVSGSSGKPKIAMTLEIAQQTILETRKNCDLSSMRLKCSPKVTQ